MTHDLSDERLEEIADEIYRKIGPTQNQHEPEQWQVEEYSLILEALKSVRDERIALVWPSEKELNEGFYEHVEAWSNDTISMRSARATTWSEAIIWLRANVKAVVVPDVSDEELKEMARKFAPLDEYPNTHWRKEGFRSGFRAALKYVQGFRAALNLLKGDK